MERKTATEKRMDIVRDFPIWKLTLVLAGKENRINELIKQGSTQNKDRSLKRLKFRRAAYRKVLLEKLILWKEGKLNEEQTYANVDDELNEELLESS